MASKPIHQITLPSHHPEVMAMGDNDTAVATVRKVPRPKPDMSEMPKGAAEGERPMPLTQDFHVMDIKRMQAGKGGSPKRPTKGNAMDYLKEQNTDEAYRGASKPTTREVN